MAASEGIVENTALLTEDKRIAAIQVGIDLGLSIEDQDTKATALQRTPTKLPPNRRSRRKVGPSKSGAPGRTHQ
ncbi:MAG TPA: hypothetical protein VGY48_29130 [Vicinamibacterales bacterium]|jgi:hypothetical protein|nr:hypothetical protein [Vicinamibacterales bacterium]